MSYKDDFLASKRKPVEVKLKSSGKKAYIRRLTNKEVGDIHLIAKKDENPDEKGINFQRALVARAVSDPDGNAFLTSDDVASLEHDEVQDLFDSAMDINKLRSTPEAEAKNSVATSGASSS